jgi:hypothetical protein
LVNSCEKSFSPANWQVVADGAGEGVEQQGILLNKIFQKW